MSFNGFEPQEKLTVHICRPVQFSLVAILIKNCKDAMFPDLHDSGATDQGGSVAE